MYSVVARYVVQRGRGEDVAQALRPHISVTRQEPGCLSFTVNRSVDDPDEFVLYELYRDRAAFDAHVASPHYQRYVVDQVRPLLEKREVSFYTPVEP
ncbi:antibiotic biosynthesis monooxygenase [Streptomyces sp. HNM0575]|nr:antibiotic biosynthesis monooxygenase [Streptomyces sp. HNM0575]